MKAEEIIEGNKVIAEFMKMKIDGDWYLIPYLESTTKTGWYQVSRMEFHSSWDWLMPVVEKISSVDAVIPKERIAICNIWAWINGCKIDYNFRTKEEDPDSSCDSIFIKGKIKLIDSVFEAVVEFIKWYNSKTAVAVTPNEVQK